MGTTSLFPDGFAVVEVPFPVVVVLKVGSVKWLVVVCVVVVVLKVGRVKWVVVVCVVVLNVGRVKWVVVDVVVLNVGRVKWVVVDVVLKVGSVNWVVVGVVVVVVGVEVVVVGVVVVVVGVVVVVVGVVVVVVGVLAVGSSTKRAFRSSGSKPPTSTSGAALPAARTRPSSSRIFILKIEITFLQENVFRSKSESSLIIKSHFLARPQADKVEVKSIIFVGGQKVANNAAAIHQQIKNQFVVELVAKKVTSFSLLLRYSLSSRSFGLKQLKKLISMLSTY